jgi:DNA-binding LacI/PurR family transcriptional regulator
MEGPKHLEIRDALVGRIRAGRLKSGQKVPSEYALAREFGVNKTTANKAVSMLVSEGYLCRKRGAGTFVADEFAGKAPLLGMYVNVRASAYAAQLLVGAQEEAAARGYGMVFFQSPTWGHEVDEDRLWRYVRSTNIRGLIINRPYQRRLEDIPTLFLDTTVPSEDVDQVQVDNLQGGRILAQHFLACGHRQVAFISQDPSRRDLTDRAKGFLSTFAKKGLGDSAGRLHAFSPAKHNLAGTIQQMLLSDHRITGIAFDSDHVALHSIPVLRRLGKRVPQDISIAGFGHVTGADSPVHLTSVDEHPYTLGHLATSALLDRVEGRAGKKRTRIIAPVELVRGDTVINLR